MKKIKLAGLFLMLIFFFLSCGKKETQQVPLGKVTKGTFYIDLYEEGEIEAINSITIAAPMISWRYGNLKITELVKDGQEVKAGDTIIVFDPSEVHKGIIEAEGRLESNKADLEKMLAQHQSDLEELRADYEVTKISQEISKIRFESAAHESDIKKKEIQLNLEKADIALERSKEQIDNKIKIQKEEVRQKKLSIAQDEAQLKEAHETLDKLIVKSPSPGIAILAHNWNSGVKFQIGDQCWAGYPLIQLPDLSALKATVKINEVDISKVIKGLRVEIKPDAFSDSIFTGTVNAVANLAVNKDDKSKIKVFPVEILINETNENLLPGLTVSCRLIVDEIDDVMYVPLDALHTVGDESYVYKKTTSGFDKVKVETGESNSDYIIILNGLDENDRVALGDPFAGTEKKEKKTNNEV
ncbi:efflux RND transporter periplasmic adaptor subunit [Paludibacter sp. 221]|uniref:efflux RND transporter periplasmic adaptor subunit n=1 Tax=Paludibacter sp. 221 TaxID=2302939 RepID=UPI0013CFA50D|nr:efflux RND transporter periplasmic adaptor subunit [Paludibacter sp. 221]